MHNAYFGLHLTSADALDKTIAVTLSDGNDVNDGKRCTLSTPISDEAACRML